MRTHSLLALLLSLAGCSGGRGASGSNEAPISPVPIHFTSPHYNDVFMKATHNAYWIEYSNGPSVDPWASGTRQRILDQLLHERVRSFELDLHRDGGHTGHFSIYHTSVTDNSTVADLENALELFKRFDYLQPDHEPVTIVLEAKEMSTGDSRLFESGWRPEDLDRTLWDYLGPRLYTPAEFMSRCPGAPNLTACAAQVGWPTMDELRGRTLVTILGNWGNNYWDWYDYAARDPHTMGAFPMRSILRNPQDGPLPSVITAGPPVVYSPAALASSFWTEQNGDSVGGLQRPYLNGNDAGFRAGLQRARDNSVFWTKEVWNYAQLVGDGIFDLTNDFLANGGIIRSPDITPWPDAKGGDPLWSWNIEMGQSLHQMMTDRPFAFPVGENGTGFWGEPAGWLPTDPSQPAMLTKIASDYPFFKQNALREPGARLYLHTSQSPPQHGAATVRFDPAATASDWWETQPSTTRTPMDGLVPRAVRGTGCLFAITPDLGTGVTLCREIVNTVPPVVGYVESEDVRLRLSINRPGSGETHDWYVPHNATTLADPGDLIAWSVVRAPTVNKTDLYVYSASNIDASGKPAWHALGVYHLDGVLSLQGLYATNDALFVGTKHNGAIVRKADFTGGISHDAGGVDELVDMTWCTDASCIGDRLPSHLTTVTDWRGRVFAGVHRSYNQLFGGQGRHLYTTDGYEATAGGMNLETANYFYVSLTAQSGWAPLYHCVDWRVDYKMSWLSRDAACATGVDTPGLNGGIIGYVSTQPITGLLPLYQTRGPQGGGKYDQFSTVDDGEHGWVLGAGYQDVALLGWVWPRSQIFTTPPVVHGPPRPTN